MATFTVPVALALPLQSAIVIGDFTSPASGMAVAVSLVTAGHWPGGLPGAVPVMCRSLFGEPVPGPVTTSEVAFATRASRTCSGVAVGDEPRKTAAAPTTCGVAIEVPLM